jgi:hypothetical protein
MTRDELIDEIHKVDALFKSTQMQGEMQAARGAREPLHAQPAAAPRPEVEFKFSLSVWHNGSLGRRGRGGAFRAS